MAKEVPIPEELKILLPDMNKGVVIVGSKAYEMYPMVEGQIEKILADFVAVMDKVNCPDGLCPKCGKVVKGALPRKVFNCPDDEEILMTMNQSPVEAIIGSGKVPAWIEMITGVEKVEVAANITLNQEKHFAGLFWKQNFSDDGLPEASKENFKKLLEMMGAVPEKKKEATPAAESEKQPPQ